MDMIERYLAAVRMALPAGQAEDILAELRDGLMAQREEQAEALRRDLSAEEEERLLHEFGHPLVVASRYGPPRYLIGPELYPIFWLVLKIVLAVDVGAAILVGVVSGVVQAGGPGFAVRQAAAVLNPGLFAAIGATTVVFAALQRYAPRLFKEWRVRDLPRPASLPRPRAPGRFDHLAAIAVQMLFVLWWIGAIPLWRSYIPLGDGQSLTLAPAPIWQALYWPILALSVVIIAVHAGRLARWGRGRAGLGMDFAMQAAVFAVAATALEAGRWAIVSGVGLAPQAVEQVRRGIDIGVEVALVTTVCVAALTAAWDLWRLARDGDGA